MNPDILKRVSEATAILPEQIEMIKSAAARGLADTIFKMAAVHNDVATLDYLLGEGRIYLSADLRAALVKSGDLSEM